MGWMRSVGAGILVAAVVALSGCSGSTSLPIAVGLTPSSPQAMDQGVGRSVAINATVTNDTSSKGVTWSVKGPGSLTSTASSTVYSPPTTSLTSAQQVTVTATSVVEPTKSASVQITVNPYPVIPSQTLANGTVGMLYSQPIALIGGTGPFQWSVYDGPIVTGWRVGGSVPNGLTLNVATGTISGTPTAAGTWYFEATLTDADGASAVNGFMSVQINPGAAVAANPVPFLNQPLVPAAVSPGGGAVALRVSGASFVSGATIDFNGTPLTTTFVDGEHLSAVIPAADVSTAGTGVVTIVNPPPGGGSSNVVYFQVGAQESTVNFANAPNSPLQIPEPFGLAIADFNQDGKPDLAVTANIRLFVMLSQGDGTFATASGSPVSIPSPPYDDFGSPYLGAVTVGDFNHSGHPGLALAEFQSAAAVILLGSGNGTFVSSSAAFALSPNGSLSAVEAADLNADGNLDLALIGSQVDLGYGEGAFNSGGNLYFEEPGNPTGAAVGDFNGDGKLDVAVATSGSTMYPGSGVDVSLGKGDGTFTQATGSPISLGQSLSAIVAGDFNGDGKLDIAVTDYSGNAVHIVLGNGDGTFQPPMTIAVGNEPEAMVVGDFNNDGRLDLAIVNYGDGTVTLLLGNGGGTFTQASGSPYLVGKAATAIAAADFNGDGRLDLAVANALDGTGSVSILLQK